MSGPILPDCSNICSSQESSGAPFEPIYGRANEQCIRQIRYVLAGLIPKILRENSDDGLFTSRSWSRPSRIALLMGLIATGVDSVSAEAYSLEYKMAIESHRASKNVRTCVPKLMWQTFRMRARVR